MARYENIYEYDSALAGDGMTVGIVMARFNQGIGEGLLSACTTELRRLGVAASNIEIATVPGALEIPLGLQTMAQSDRFDALIALVARAVSSDLVVALPRQVLGAATFSTNWLEIAGGASYFP